MCDCVSKLKIRLEERFKEWDGKKVLRFEAQNSMLGFESGSIEYGMGFNIHVAGQKKPKYTTIRFSNCPFCGEKIDYKPAKRP